MKTLLLLVVICLFSFEIFAQVPKGMKYQAVLRDKDGQILSSKSINLKISIIQGQPNGTIVYSEGYYQITTNIFGIVNLTIGKGTPTFGDFSQIDWSTGVYFVQIAIDLTGNGNYEIASISQLLSVPYALYAGSAPITITGTGSTQVKGTYPNYNIYTPIWDSNSFTKEYQTLSLNGNVLSISHGNSIKLPFSNTGLQNTISLPPSRNNGEIAFWNTGLADWVSDPIFFWDETALKMGIGTSSPAQQLDITQNFQLPNTTSSSGIIYKNGSTFIHNYGTNNTFTGINSGNLSITGTDITGVGYEALNNNSSGSYNTAIGSQALSTNFSGYGNTGIGYMANVFYTNLTNATAIGYGAIALSNDEVRLGNNDVTSLYCQGAYYPVTSDIPNLVVEPNGQILRSTTTTPMITLSGDVTGPENMTTVIALQGNPIAYGTPSNGQALIWNSGVWTPLNIAFSGDVIGSINMTSVIALQGNAISPTPPTSGQALIWNGTNWTPTTIGSVGGSGNTNQLAYWTTTNTIGSNSLLYWDITNNKLGIGTTSPSTNADLDINGYIYEGGNLFIHNYGNNNTFTGINSGNLSTTGNDLTGIGYQSLYNNYDGIQNSAFGSQSLFSNHHGSNNVAVGTSALYYNDGVYNHVNEGSFILKTG